MLWCMNVKESKARNQRLLFLFLLISIPLIAFSAVRTEWIARIVAVAGLALLCNGTIFWYGFNPKTNFIWKYSKWAKQTEGTQRIGRILFRLLTIISGFVLLLFITKPIVCDALKVISQGKK